MGGGTKVLSAEFLDRAMVVCVAGLILVLPVAHTTSIRAGFVVLATLFLAARMVVTKRLTLPRTPLEIPMFAFFYAIIVSLFFSLNLPYSLDELRGEFLTCTLVFYVAAASVTTEARLKAVVGVVVLGSLVMAVYGIADFLSRSDGIFDISIRAGSLHQGYEAYGQYIITTAPFMVAGFVAGSFGTGRRCDGTGWPAWFSWVALGAAVLNAAALFFTHTRGAWLAFWVELLLVALLVVRGRALRWAVVAALVIMPVLGLYLLPEKTVWHGPVRLSAEARSEVAAMSSAEVRIVVWRSFFEDFSRDPLTPAGYGKTNFRRKYSKDGVPRLEQAHNTFVNTAAMLGVQGLAALLAIIAVLIRTARRTAGAAANPTDRGYALSMIVMTAGFFTANQFAEFYIDDTALMFWLFAGVLVGVYNRTYGQYGDRTAT